MVWQKCGRTMLILTASTLASGCVRDLLPLRIPDGGNLARCSQAEIQAAGSVVSAGGRVDTCQCIQSGPGWPGSMTIELPGCKATFGPTP